MFWDDESAFADYAQKDWDLWSELGAFVDFWRSTYQEYWGIRSHERPAHIEEDDLWATVKQQAHNAPRIAQIASELRLGREPLNAAVDLKPLRDYLRDYATSPVISDRIALDVASDAIDQLRNAHQRLVRLLSLFVAQALTPRTEDYLRRSARLYVWGFEVESLVLCRAALEAALVEVLVDPDDAPPNLDTLLKIAGRKGVLPGYIADDARKRGWRAEKQSLLWQAVRIRDMAGHALHGQPAFRQEEGDLRDAYSVLRSLMRILDRVFRWQAEE